MNTTQKLRGRIAAQPTSTLIDLMVTSEAQGERLSYALAAAEVSRRLDIDPAEAIASGIGPTEYLRAAWEVAA